MEAIAGIWFFVVLLAVILIIAWIILPIAVIGTKPILREILRELKRMNDRLEDRPPRR